LIRYNMMNCSICGAENIPEAKFCRACGTSLQEHSKEIIVVTEPINVNRFMIKNRFKILKKLGKGGMGEVLLAEDLKLKRKVAIKSILKSSLADNTSKIRFLREAQTASQLDHTNICTIYEIYEEDEKDYIVMQYIDGVTLDQIVGAKKLSIDKILDISVQVCEGMIEAHAKDIIHRDIKPGNIIIDNKGTVKILDFGLAKFTDDATDKTGAGADSDLTQKGFVMGTIAYISPEQAKGKDLDRRSDIFSFGVVLYEMLEGKNPFRVDEQIETLYNVLNKKIEFERDIPAELKEIVSKALEKDRGKRYPDFASLKEDLDAFQEFYARLKERKAQARVTEIINLEEQEKILEEAQKTSDKENLGEMVDRIKRMKASTERVEPTRKKSFKPLWAVPIVALALIVVLFQVFKNKEKNISPNAIKEGRFYIYLHPLENETGDTPVAEMLNYLLLESLNQFAEFKIIDRATALSTVGQQSEGSEATAAQNPTGAGKIEQPIPAALKQKFNIDIRFELSGAIKKARDTYTIDAYLKSEAEGTKPVRIPASGLNKDSFLQTQVDMLADGVYRHVFPDQTKKPEIKRLERIYGNNWTTFADFYTGLGYFNKVEYSKAEKYFKKSQDLLISKYYLSQIYYFIGKRDEALELIHQVISLVDKLTPSLQARARAMEARLNFKFNDEVKYLEQLKDEFPFSPDILFELGEAYFHHANPIKAMEYYQQVLALDKDYSKALNHLGYCYSYIGDHTQALKAFERYSELDQTPNSFDSLGDGHFYYGQLEFARSMKISAVSQTDEQISYPYQTLADIYILKGEYEQANLALKKYRHLERDKSAEAYVLAKQAFMQYNDRQYPQALELIDQSLAAHDAVDINDSTTPEVHWLKGLILLALDKLAESKEQLQWLDRFRIQFNLDKDNFKAAYKYFIHLNALILEKENRLPEAEETFKALLAMKNSLSYWITYYNYQFFHTEYTRFLSRQKKYQEALDQLSQCLNFNGNYLPALWVKADLLEKLNKGDEAKPVYEKIAELYGQSGEKNYYRNRLKEKLRPLPVH
jgi:serine/threonine protein kinase